MAGQSQRIVEIFLPELLVMKGEEKLKTGRAAVLLTEGNGVQHLGLVQNMKREDLPEYAGVILSGHLSKQIGEICSEPAAVEVSPRRG